MIPLGACFIIECENTEHSHMKHRTVENKMERVRKFGLQACDLPTMLWNVSVLLRLLTVNIDSKYKGGIPILYYILTAITAACYFYTYLFSMAWFVFYRSMETREMLPAMVVLSLGITSEIGNLKLIYMVLHIDKIKKIADDYLSFDAQVIKGSRYSANLMLSLRNVKKRAIIYWMVLVGNGVIYLVSPLFLTGRNLPENYFILYGLEPMFESPNFEIAYFMMVAGITFVVYVPANVTAYLIVIAGYTESQLLALSQEIIHIWPDALKEANIDNRLVQLNKNNKKIVNDIVEKRLKEIVKRHATVVNLLLQVEDVFRGAIAMGFILLILGLIAELLGKLENTYLQMPFAFMQVAMDCFTGQRVMDASVVFEQAVYDSRWENFDKRNMKVVLVMLQNAQKTLTLSAGGITMLSFSCLMSVTKGIYSAYNALRATVK